MNDDFGPIVGTLFDSNKTDPQPNFSRITIADFDLYVHILYTYVSFFFDCELSVNRIEKKFHLTIPRHQYDWNNEKEYNPISKNLCRVEYFQIALNAQWILYSFDAINKIKQLFNRFEKDYRNRFFNLIDDVSQLTSSYEATMVSPGYVSMRSDLNHIIRELNFNNDPQYADELCELTRIRDFIKNC